MNINGDRWRAGTGCQWMAFCSASDSSAPLMGSAWLDSIMSPDTLWRGCKLSISPLSPIRAWPSSAAVFTSFPMIILPSFTLLPLSNSSSHGILHIISTSCFSVIPVLIRPYMLPLTSFVFGKGAKKVISKQLLNNCGALMPVAF